jgi:hypothetical protein
MAGIGVKNKLHILRDNSKSDGTGIPVGAGGYTCEAIKDGILFANQGAVDTYATARGFAAGDFVFTTLP